MNFNDSLAGLIVGFMVGLTGMGGASLMAPVLIYLFHVKAKIAVGSDLAYASVAKGFSSIQHARTGNVDFPLVSNLAIASIPSSLLGVWLLHSIDKNTGRQAETLIAHILAVALIVVALILVARSIPRVEVWFANLRPLQPKQSRIGAIVVGLIGGFLVGLTSIGGGTLFGAALILLFGLRAKKMVGTDIFHGFVLSAVAAAGHTLAGDVDFPLVGSLLIGAIPGVLLGGLLCARIPERALSRTVGAVLLITAVRILV